MQGAKNQTTKKKETTPYPWAVASHKTKQNKTKKTQLKQSVTVKKDNKRLAQRVKERIL